ncbi:PASTA domain-containing protein [Caulobacter soli]|uniref:PASTA domain-containing protein n=1 Tax=Caulobacter soli TaxID=2708539 RepID=UPI0013ED7AC2|nr:PASTA domain-containing protein [Caulobacter soli]
MPSFEIPDGPTTVALKTEAGFHKGTAVFGVTNKTGEGLTGRFSVQVQGNGKAEWYSVQGEPERPVAAGETQTVTVVAKIPAATPAGQHRIKLRATNVNDPDNDSTESAAAIVTIPAVAKPPAKKKPFPMWILAVVGGVLVLVIGVIIAVVVMNGGSKVPKVVGLDYPAAVAALKEKGYAAEPEIREAAPDKPLDKVFKQDPEGGTKADPKTVKVKLTVAGVPTVAVPGVTGLDYPTAVAALEKSGFKAGPAIEEVSSDKSPGLVFKQEPAADEQADPKTIEVKLTVAVGETVDVPVVLGKPFVAAQALLEDRGFTVASPVVGQASGKQPDAVLVQDPVGDTKAPKGSVVRLTIDPGVIVPNLITPQINGIAGIQALKNAGADIGSISSSCRGTPNMIVAQSIEPKTKVAQGTRVNITIASATANINASVLCRSVVDLQVLTFSNQVRGTKVLTPNVRTLQPK